MTIKVTISEYKNNNAFMKIDRNVQNIVKLQIIKYL